MRRFWRKNYDIDARADAINENSSTRTVVYMSEPLKLSRTLIFETLIFFFFLRIFFDSPLLSRTCSRIRIRIRIFYICKTCVDSYMHWKMKEWKSGDYLNSVQRLNSSHALFENFVFCKRCKFLLFHKISILKYFKKLLNIKIKYFILKIKIYTVIKLDFF